jgi:hypothetical protein
MTAGITRLPSPQFGTTTQSGQYIPAYGSVIVVKDTGGYTGWIDPQVEFVAGHSITGQVIDTEGAGEAEYAGTPGSAVLVPGQSETLYAQYQGSYAGYVTAQLTSASYGPRGTGTCCGTTVQFRYGS